MERKPGFGKKEVEHQHADKGGSKPAKAAVGDDGRHQHPKNIQRDDVGLAEAQRVESKTDKGGGQQHQNALPNIPDGHRPGEPSPRRAVAGGVHVRDHMDVHIGRGGDKPLGKGGLAEDALAGGRTAADHDFCGPAEPGKFRDLIGHVLPIGGFDLRPQPPCQARILPKAAPVFRPHGRNSTGRLHKQSCKAPPESPGHPGGGADELLVGGGRGQAHQNVFAGPVIPPAPGVGALRKKAHPVGAAAQGQRPQGGEILHGEEALPGYLSAGEPLQQARGLHVHQLHLGGPVKDGIRDALLHRTPGNCLHHVVQALDALDVHGGVHVHPGPQQLLHILIPLGMAAARSVGVGQLVHQNQPGAALHGGVDVELLNGPVQELPGWDLLDVLQQRGGPGPAVGLDGTGGHVDAPGLGLPGRLEHGVGLAHPRRVSEKDFKPSPAIRLQAARKLVWVLHSFPSSGSPSFLIVPQTSGDFQLLQDFHPARCSR